MDACFAPGFVGYNGNFNGPEYWQVSVVGLDSLRTVHARAVEHVAGFARHPEWSHSEEVLHIHVKDNHAILCAQHRVEKPDPANRETISNEWREVSMLARIRGEWKITAGICWAVAIDGSSAIDWLSATIEATIATRKKRYAHILFSESYSPTGWISETIFFTSPLTRTVASLGVLELIR